MTLKPGSKLKSIVCDTEVMLIKIASDGELSCGGSPMAAERPAETGTVDSAFSAGCKTGKRYVNADGSLEVLCVKAGSGSLSWNGSALSLKDAKPLPSSD